MRIREGTVRANGITFAYLEQGSGPLVLLFHGFPDIAWTWEPQMQALADAGYRAVAPFIRGYPPTEVGGYYDLATNASDAAGLIDALGDGEPASVVGHDWGATMVYGVSAASPEKVRRAVAIAVPLPRAAAGIFTMPEVLHANFHFWFFQLAGFPEAALTANDYAFIDYLWRVWEPGHDEADHLKRVKETLARPGALDAALGYYRAVLDPARWDPALADMGSMLSRDIPVPTLTIFGSRDLLQEVAREQGQYFTGAYRQEIVDGGSHFVHRSRPERVTELIVGWLSENP
jgi:pimeloyl-ACP methyl ester carboxylesterase